MTQLANKALLVNLHISQWTARKLDRRITREVTQAHGAAEDVGNFNKQLLAPEHLQKIQLAASQARSYHYRHTLPWSDSGERILPSRLHSEYNAKMRELRSEFDLQVGAFLARYAELVEAAEERLNGMFNKKDYPVLDRLARKFDFDVHYSAVPRASDFRVDLQQAEVERIRASIQKRSTALEHRALHDVAKRLHQVVAKMAETLADPKAKFRDSLVNNVGELCRFLPKLNVTDDPTLAATIRTVDRKLAGLEPKVLRRNKRKRRDAATDARAMADQVGRLMSAYTGEGHAAPLAEAA